MYSILLSACLAALLLTMGCEARLRKYEDKICVLTGGAPRDAREAHVFETTKTQRCWLYAGANTMRPGRMNYKVVGTPSDSPRKFVWRLEDAVIEIDKSNLDMGFPANDHSHSYIHLLDDAAKTSAHPTGTAVTGMVLGEKLGGSGHDQQNLFPAAQKSQGKYHEIEDKIYSCLKSGAAHKATLEWKFKYQLDPVTSADLRTRAYTIWYRVRFHGENNVQSSCADIDEHLDN